MGRLMFGIDSSISFIEDTHQYFDETKREFKSVTRVLNSLRVPFERDQISRRMALSSVSNGIGTSVEAEQQRILSEWDGIREDGTSHGEFIHDGIENFLKFGKRDPAIESVLDVIRDLVKPFYRYYSETILYDNTSHIAGTTDLVVQRQNTTNSLYDFWDYKTNKSKGILFDSIGRKENQIKHYNRMLLPPVDYIEECSYNIDCLQVSFYAYLAQETYGINIGRLGIIFIDQELNCHPIPVPYMKEEIIHIIAHYIGKLRLPDDYVSVFKETEEEDWSKPTM